MSSPYMFHQTMATNQLNGTSTAENPNYYNPQYYYQQQPRMSNPMAPQPVPYQYMTGYNGQPVNNVHAMPPPPNTSNNYWGPSPSSSMSSNTKPNESLLNYPTQNGPSFPPASVSVNSSLTNDTHKDGETNGLTTHTQNSESSLSSSPEHSASEASPAGSGVEGGESESAESDAVSGNTARSEHTKTSSGAAASTGFQPALNYYSTKTSGNSAFGIRPTSAPGAHSYPTPSWQQSRNQFGMQQQSNWSAYQPPSQFAPYNMQNQTPQNMPGSRFPNRPPQMMGAPNMNDQFSNLSLSNAPPPVPNFSQKPHALQPVNLLSNRHILPEKTVQPAAPKMPEQYQGINCDPNIFRCTLTAIPQKQEEIAKAKLPFGLIIHPFKDLQNLPVIQSPVIVRCKSCRTYINPFVTFVDQRRWKCNICYRINEVPSDFVVNSNGRTEDVTSRPEIRNCTVEFIAPGDYMLRPPQAALYLFLLDVSAQAVATGYLDIVCSVLKDNLNTLPGDARTKISVICFDSAIHFLAVLENQEKAQLLTFPDIEDLELPRHDDLLVNLHENLEKVEELLERLPSVFRKNVSTRSALGSALTAGQKLLTSTGGRITVFQTILPSLGPGALQSREDPNERAATDIKNLKPATDFYKSLALTCSGHQIAIDLFLLNSQYADLATLSGMSRFCAGSVQTFPNIAPDSAESERLEKDFTRYLTRKIGFEAVLRVRCTKGLTVSDFYGNFFVRSTDLLAFPNVNPDAGVSMRVKIEDNLTSASHVCFQAALLYTSSKGERRIRVHTLYLPLANSVQDVIAAADVQAVTCFLAQMAVDRSLEATVSDARDALVNAVSDCLASYRSSLPGHASMGTVLIAPPSLSLFPLFVSGLLKSRALRVGSSTKLDDRIAAMIEVLSMPIFHIMHMIYPTMYPVHTMHLKTSPGTENEDNDQTPTASDVKDVNTFNFEGDDIAKPPILQLSAENLAREGVYLLDKGKSMVMLVRSQVPINWCLKVLNVANPNGIPTGGMRSLPELDNPVSRALRAFISHLLESRPNHAPLLIIRDNDPLKTQFFECMVDDRSENSSSYVEFLQHINNCIVKTKTK